MTTFTPAAAYWTAVLAESGASDRAAALATLLTTGTKLKFYDSGGTLIRTVTSAAWMKGALTQDYYPITPGAFTGSQTGTGTPATVVVTTSADVEIFRTTAGVLSGVFSIPSAFATSVDLAAGSFKLKYPSDITAPSGKVWNPGHYLRVTDEVTRMGITSDTDRNRVKNDSNWAGYYGHYWWHRLESTQGVYDFSIITADLDKAEADGKKMWVWLNNRSFHGSARGSFCPAYIVNAGWTYSYTGGGQNFAGPKLWVSGCGSAWLDMLDACLAEINDHPALQGVATEECQLSGGWLQSGYTWQAMNAFLLEQSRRGAAGIGNALFHNNMGWSNEPSSDTTEHYRMTDTMVRVHRTGLCPNDLALSTYAKYNANDYGKYIFDRYAGEAYFYGLIEWIAYFQPETPRQLIENAQNIGVQFMGWQPVTASNATFTINDVIAEVTRTSGVLNSDRPTNAAA
jgi:hypothetical protein